MTKRLIFALILFPLIFSCGKGNDYSEDKYDQYYYGDSSRNPSGPTLEVKYHDGHVSDGRSTSKVIPGEGYWIEIPGRKCSHLTVYEEKNPSKVYYSDQSASSSSCRMRYRFSLYNWLSDSSVRLQAVYYNVDEGRKEYSHSRSISKKPRFQPPVQ